MIYIYDLVGNKSGMMYYDDVFVAFLKEHKMDACVVSNYPQNTTDPVLKNIYQGTTIVKLYKLFYNLFILLKLLLYSWFKRDYVIYLAYGVKVDLPFLFIGRFSSKFIVDVHEYVYLDGSNDEKLKKRFDGVYNKLSNCIYHSNRIKKLLEDDKKKLFYVPHFKYGFDKTYDLGKISDEVKELISYKKVNVLFFGHLRRSKGIDLLIDVFNRNDCHFLDHFHFIVAGADPHNEFVDSLTSLMSIHDISVLCRYIEADELNFLFSKVDLILLPYHEVSQSGVLETAAYFQKELILSNIDYFVEFLRNYPSFGYIMSDRSSEGIRNVLFSIDKSGIKEYTKPDIDKFYQKDIYEQFAKELNSFVNTG